MNIMKILIVEDQYFEEAEESAIECGFECVIAKTKEEADALLDDPSIKGALLDLNFPPKKGMEPEAFGNTLVCECDSRKIPCVICTGAPYTEEWEEKVRGYMGAPVVGFKNWQRAIEKLRELMGEPA